jgi:hypothetical protein
MAGRACREDAMKVITCSLLVLHLAAGVAAAQTFNDLQIRLGAYTVAPDGGDKPLGGWFSTGPVIIGKAANSTFSFGDTCEAFGISSANDLREDAITAWKIEITPVRVVGDAVTFRLRWTRFAGLRQQLDRALAASGKSVKANDDVELTLRPGESWPVDTWPVPAGAKTVDGRACGPSSSIRVLVDTYPWEQEDRRLVAADLWLVERLANGTEAQRGQPLSVRGLPNRPIAFYFDSVVDANVPLDIYGTLVPHLASGAMAVSFDTRCRWGRETPGFMGPQRSVTSEVQVKPSEVVEVRLPKLGDGPFASRDFSIRIRTRQLR